MMMQGRSTRVAIVGGARTPFAKAGTVFRRSSPLELSVHAVNGLLRKQNLEPELVDELAYGITVVDARIPHFAREVVLASNLPSAVPALTPRYSLTSERVAFFWTLPLPRRSASGFVFLPDSAHGISSLPSPACRSRPPVCRWANIPSSWSRSGKFRVWSKMKSRTAAT